MLRVALLSYFVDNVEAELLVVVRLDNLLALLMLQQRTVISLLLVPL